MNTRYQTRLQSRLQKSTDQQECDKPIEFSSNHCYNTRLQNRLNDSNYQETKHQHRYNTRKIKTTYNITFDFDEASNEWNRNKRRVGQMYEYI